MKHIITVILILLALPAYAQTARSKFEQAQTAYEAGRYGDALSYLAEAETALAGTNARIQSLRVLVYYDQGNNEKALEELTRYFKVVPASMQGTDGYKTMLDLQTELKSAVDQNFSKQQKKIEEEHNNEQATLNREREQQEEQFYYDLVKDSPYPQAISDFLYKYPGTPYRQSLEKRLSGLNTSVSMQAHPEQYIAAAVKKEDNALIDKLLSYGCNVNIYDDGKTPIIIATEKDNIGIVRKLFGAGADVNSTDREGRTALCVAIENGYSEITDFLINAGTNINKTDNKGEGPLFYAIRANNEDLVRTLMTYGVNIKETNSEGLTPLIVAIKRSYPNNNIINDLLYRDSRINVKIEGNTPLCYAVSKDATEIVRTLLSYGADPAIISSQGSTMLYIAVSHKNTAMAAQLLEGKANPNHTSRDNFAPLHYAVWDHQKDMTGLLLRNGANVNQQGLHGWTPLHFACREQAPELVALLLDSHANPRIKDEWKRIPKKIAKERHFKDVKKALRR